MKIRPVTAVIALSVLALMLPTLTTAAADEAVPVNPRCGAAANQAVPDGEPIQVSLPPATFTVGSIPASWWRNPPSADPAWKLEFLGMMWVRPLAVRAAKDGQRQSIAALADQVVKFHQQSSDAGTSAYGWDEGTAMRRLETQNCLYEMTRSAALKPGMNANAAVLLSSRYYGPPYKPVHNHGLMANLQLFKAGTLLGKVAWRETAAQRLASEAPQAFSRLGTMFEQASAYQSANANLWGQAVAVLDEGPGAEWAAARIRLTVAKARIVFEWMTEPDGKIVQVGDSDLLTGRRAPLAQPGVFRDDQTGWVIGRWSWTDPDTSYYTLRYGPVRRAHGHNDRAGGVTWSAKGVRVLIGPGRYTSDLNSPFHAFQIGPQGQNVAIPDSRAATGAATVTGSRISTAAHSWTITDKVYGISHTRGVTVNRDVPSMTVSDAFTGSSVTKQYWHLDPAWTHVSGGWNSTKLVFAHPSGRRLTVTTTGRVFTLKRGVKQPVQGFTFPKYGVANPAYEVVIRSSGSATTTFVVS